MDKLPSENNIEQIKFIKELLYELREYEKKYDFKLDIFGGFVRTLIRHVSYLIAKEYKHEIPISIDISDEKFNDIDIQVYSKNQSNWVGREIREIAKKRGWAYKCETIETYSYHGDINSYKVLTNIFTYILNLPAFSNDSELKQRIITACKIINDFVTSPTIYNDFEIRQEREKHKNETSDKIIEDFYNFDFSKLIEDIKEFTTFDVTQFSIDYGIFIMSGKKYTISKSVDNINYDLQIDVIRPMENSILKKIIKTDNVYDADINTLGLCSIDDNDTNNTNDNPGYEIQSSSEYGNSYNIISRTLKKQYIIPGMKIQNRIDKLNQKGYRMVDTEDTTIYTDEILRNYIKEIKRRIRMSEW